MYSLVRARIPTFKPRRMSAVGKIAVSVLKKVKS